MDKQLNAALDFMDKYDITLDRIFKLAAKRVYNDEVNMLVPLDELRKWNDQMLRLRNAFPKEQKQIDSEVIFRWETGDEE